MPISGTERVVSESQKSPLSVSEGYFSSDSGSEMEVPNGLEKRRLKPKSSTLKSKNQSQEDLIAAQSALLLEKMELLEKKLQVMQGELEQEKQSRMKLEVAVSDLENENKQLKSTRSSAHDILQKFTNVVYKEFDVLPKVSSQESLLDARSHKSYNHSIGSASRISRQSIRSNSSCSSMSSMGSTDPLQH